MEEAKRAIQIEPDYAEAWLGSEFFSENADRPNAAISAFHKLPDLYSGYSERDTILQVLSELVKRRSADGILGRKSDLKAVQSRPLPESSYPESHWEKLEH